MTERDEGVSARRWPDTQGTQLLILLCPQCNSRVLKSKNQNGRARAAALRSLYVETSCHKGTPCSDIASVHTQHTKRVLYKRTPTDCNTAAASHPLPSRRGLACASPARRRGAYYSRLLQVYSRSTPGLLVHVVGEGGPAGPHLARLLLGVVRELQPLAALRATRRRADGPALGGESRGLVRG